MEGYAVALVGILALFGFTMFVVHVARANDRVREVLTQAREGADNEAAVVRSPETMHSVGGR